MSPWLGRVPPWVPHAGVLLSLGAGVPAVRAGNTLGTARFKPVTVRHKMAGLSPAWPAASGCSAHALQLACGTVGPALTKTVGYTCDTVG